jgi:hypothetical protein
VAIRRGPAFPGPTDRAVNAQPSESIQWSADACICMPYRSLAAMRRSKSGGDSDGGGTSRTWAGSPTSEKNLLMAAPGA